MDEYYETKKKVDQKKEELKDLSNKFKELKSLIYDYRDKKESEIEKLNLDHENLKQEIDDNQKKYENLIDEAADQISNFVKKAKLENISNKVVNKSKLRSKILNLRKKNSNKKLSLNSDKIYRFLKKNKINFKNVGGYYPCNHEIDDLDSFKFF